ncbi:unnamed protein product [Adineta ricciae]|uniref:C-type lectin domain-containing protein n=3 Tax=Adineta ricciae TaxID=249248 RepID=A0A814VHB5_ADIRI|nr:unnamed protein product [Adineta ricciae]
MASIYSSEWLLIGILLHLSAGISFNQPKFSPCAYWNPNGTFFANASSKPFGLFVSVNNIVYASEQATNRFQVWSNSGDTPIRTASAGLSNPAAIFVHDNGDVYIDKGSTVAKWTSNSTSSIDVMNVDAQCMGMFVDMNNALYCSAGGSNKVLKRALNSSTMNATVIAGNGTCSSQPNTICNPHGIFIDNNLTLYIAEYGLSRINRFRNGEVNGTAIVGSMVPGTFSLSSPMGVVLDVDGYLFIVDQGNNRIVGSGPLGFRCIVGCSGSSGSALNQLQGPRSLAFDTDGNLYVSDRENDRIMTYTLFNSSCVYTTTTSTSTSSTSTTSTSTTSTSTSTTSTSTSSTSSTSTTSTSTSTTSTSTSSTSTTSTKTTSTSTSTTSTSSTSSTSTTSTSTSTTSTSTSSTSTTSTSTTSTSTTSTKTTSTSTLTTSTSSTSSTSTTSTSTSTTSTSTSTSSTSSTKTTSTSTSTSTTSTSSTSTTSTSSTSTTSTSTKTTSTSTSTTSTSTSTTSTSTSSTSTTSTKTTSTSTLTSTTSIISTSTTVYSVSNVSNCSFTKYSSYLVSNVKSDFTSAQICCESMNMTLIEIESANEQARILNITTLIQAPFLIGLNQTCGTNNYSAWLSGKPVLFSNFGQPSDCSRSKQCFVYENNSDARWIAVNCSLLSHFVCESYQDISYQWRRSAGDGTNNIQTAYLSHKNERTTVYQQVNLGETSLLRCSKSCFKNSNCIAIKYEQSNCQLFLS